MQFRIVNDPDAPSNLMFTWNPPIFSTGEVKNYLLYYRPDNIAIWFLRKLPGDFLSYNVTDFEPGMKYHGYVVAVDEVGRGKETREKFAVTLRGNV